MREFSPSLMIPMDGFNIWDWFYDLNDCVFRIFDNICRPIPPSEYLAWAELRGIIVYPYEYDILREMDRTYCEEKTKEMQSAQERRDAERKKEIDAAAKNKRRK